MSMKIKRSHKGLLLGIFLLVPTTSIISPIKFCFRTNKYATHQPILYELVTKTTGPIIEFGCGDGSTDLLHEMCKRTGRILISLDDDAAWLNKYKQRYVNDGYQEDNSGWHKFYFVSGKNDPLRTDNSPRHWIKFLDEAECIKGMTFAICFIDQSPFLARYETLKRLKTKSTYIILHDCDYFPYDNVFGTEILRIDEKNSIQGIYDFSDVFKYFKVYFPPHPWPGSTGPPTLVGSDFESDLPEIDYSCY